jgi:hypothetical protein
MQNLKETNILLTKWKLLSREKPLQGSQTQEIYYSEDKASYKALVLTYIWCNSHTFNSDTYLYVNASQSGLLPEGVFNEII